MTLILVAPHLLHRKECADDVRFPVGDDTSLVVCPCPHCKSTKSITRAFTPFIILTALTSGQRGLGGVICLISEEIYCKSCAKKLSAVLDDHGYFPAAMRNKFADLVLMHVGAITSQLAHHLFVSTSPMSKLAEQHAAHFMHSALFARADYAHFVAREQSVSAPRHPLPKNRKSTAARGSTSSTR